MEQTPQTSHDLAEPTAPEDSQSALHELLPRSTDSLAAGVDVRALADDYFIGLVLSDDPPTEVDLDRIIAALDIESIYDIPEPVIRAAQRYRDEITPRFIDLLRNATQTVQNGGVAADCGFLIGFLLLTEFRATEALPAIIEAISLPGEMPDDLFGDSIFENLPGALAALAVEQPEIIDALIGNLAIHRSVRGAVAGVYLFWVRDGRLTREAAVARLQSHLQQACEMRDDSIASYLVGDLCSFAPAEAIETIEQAYRLGIVDEMYIVLEEIQDSIAEGESYFQNELRVCRPTGINDTQVELDKWRRLVGWSAPEPGDTTDDNAWLDDVEADLDDGQNYPGDWAPDDDDEGPIQGSTTIVNSGPRAGRNEPCICGSGKKYKKCCGGR